MIQRINESKCCFFEEINKIDKPLSDSSKKERVEPVNKIRNESGETTDTKKK